MKKDISNILTQAFKVGVTFSKSDELILDGQSKIANWIYNQVLEKTIDDYKNNNNLLKLTSGYNGRNYMVNNIKPVNKFIESVYCSVYKNAALRVKKSFKQFFERGNFGYPKFNSWKENWFSLEYDQPNTQGIKIDGNKITFTLGKDQDGKRLYVTGKLDSIIKYKDYVLNTVILTKEKFKSGDKFFISFSCDLKKKEIPVNKDRWCSIDPNHKNMFVATDYKLNTMEFSTIQGIKDIDKEIDKVKSKRDVCRKMKIKKIKDNNGEYIKTDIIKESKRYKLLSKTIDKLNNKRREQIKQILYSIAHFLCKNYNYIMIGDYTPSIDVAKEKNMRRPMLNQTFIGKFRNILKHVCLKSHVNFIIINEKDTTAKCSRCGNYEKKGPEVRDFICPVCVTHFNRDINSDLNIAFKGGVNLNLSGTDYLTLNKVKYNVLVNRRSYSNELRTLSSHINTAKRSSDVGKSSLFIFK